MGNGQTFGSSGFGAAFTDGITADFHLFEMKSFGETATRAINEIKGFNRWCMATWDGLARVRMI